jgi:hypothetical protein
MNRQMAVYCVYNVRGSRKALRGVCVCFGALPEVLDSLLACLHARRDRMVFQHFNHSPLFVFSLHFSLPFSSLRYLSFYSFRVVHQFNVYFFFFGWFQFYSVLASLVDLTYWMLMWVTTA